MLTQLERWRGLPFLVPRALSFPPRWPNTPIQPTPLRVDEIGAILAGNFCYNDIWISSWRRG